MPNEPEDVHTPPVAYDGVPLHVQMLIATMSRIETKLDKHIESSASYDHVTKVEGRVGELEKRVTSVEASAGGRRVLDKVIWALIGTPLLLFGLLKFV